MALGGAGEVAVEGEIARVAPVIHALVESVGVPISIDTSKPEVMHAAISAGAGFINDVYARRRDRARDVAAELKLPVCLMPMRGEPHTIENAVCGRHFAFRATRLSDMLVA